MSSKVPHRAKNNMAPGFPPPSWPKEEDYHPWVQYLKEHLTKIDRWESLQEAVYDSRYEEKIIELEEWNISTADDFLGYASYLLTDWKPSEQRDGKFVYYILTVFYFVLDRPSIADLQTPIQRSSIAGDMPVLLPLSNWIVGYAKRIGLWLDDKNSLDPEGYQSIVDSPPYRMKEPTLDYLIPDSTSPVGGFSNFNEFFCRELKNADVRPILSSPKGEVDNVVVFPADSVYDGHFPISDNSKVKIKGIHWPVSSLLAGSKYKDRFRNGIWSHAFLNAYNYHRKHSPVAGKVLEAYNVEGCCYLQVVTKEEPDGRKRLISHRPWVPKHLDRGLKTPQPDAPDEAGYQFIQERAVVIIDTGREDVGLVAVIPMGMAIVSSVNLLVKKGDDIAKGTPISYFKFGGSDIVVMFEEKARVGTWPKIPPELPEDRIPQTNFMGERYCEFHTG